MTAAGLEADSALVYSATSSSVPLYLFSHVASDPPMTALAVKPGRAATVAAPDRAPSTYNCRLVPPCVVNTTWCHLVMSTVPPNTA